MKLSTRGRYALRMMLDITRSGGTDKPISLAEVAGHTDISRGYLEQLALALRNAGLLRGISGRYGGYKLARAPADISLRVIIEAAIGPINIVDCVANPEECMRSDMCDCRVVYQLINQRISEVLDEYSLADLEIGAVSSSGIVPIGKLIGD
jgi:Rrf2 family cysteine metabolism transcriptional repressor